MATTLGHLLCVLCVGTKRERVRERRMKGRTKMNVYARLSM